MQCLHLKASLDSDFPCHQASLEPDFVTDQLDMCVSLNFLKYLFIYSIHIQYTMSTCKVSFNAYLLDNGYYFLSFSLSGLPPPNRLFLSSLTSLPSVFLSLCWWLYSGLSMQGGLVWYSLYFDLSINMHTSVRRPLCVCVCFCLCVYAYVCIHMKARENP